MKRIQIKIDEDHKFIEEYPLTTIEGTKKMMRAYHVNAVNVRNDFIKNSIDKYTLIRYDIYEEMRKRVEALTPKDSSSNYVELNEKINVFKSIIKCNNPYNTLYEKLDIDKIVNNIGDIDVSTLPKVNSLISRVIDIFKAASINLSYTDFDYSMYAEKYMKVFFESKDKESFKDDILAIFNTIYWECPDLTTHIKLSIRHLYSKYEKELKTYYLSYKNSLMSSNNTSEDTYFDDYNRLNSELSNLKKKDTYLLSLPFINGDLSIYEYLNSSSQVKSNLNKFLIGRDFDELNDTEKANLFERIKNLKYVVVELNNYNKYKVIIDDMVKRYKNKDSYKGVYQTKLKEVEKEEKERLNLISQYNKRDISFLFIKNNVNRDLLKVKINEHIKKLNDLYKELDDAYINDFISTNLDDTSTVNDALKVCVSFYGYFKGLYNKIDSEENDFDYIKEYNELFDYTYSTDNSIVRKVKFLDENDVSEIVFDKYKLLNINVSKEDLTTNISQFEETIDYVNLLNNINNSDISINDIKFIVDFNKINKN